MANNFIFSPLEGNDKRIVIDAMEQRVFKKGDVVIKQGDPGSELFIVDSGNLECLRKMDSLSPEKLLKTYGPGDAFGELALLYNAPR